MFLVKEMLEFSSKALKNGFMLLLVDLGFKSLKTVDVIIQSFVYLWIVGVQHETKSLLKFQTLDEI